MFSILDIALNPKSSVVNEFSPSIFSIFDNLLLFN